VETVANENSTNTTTNVLLTPALLVNGDLTVNGNVRVTGSNGTVHANGNLSLVGNWLIEGDAHAAGLLNRKGNGTTLGEESGSKPTITVPNVDAARYQDQATHRLENNQVHVVGRATCHAPCLGWSFVNGEWRTTGGLPSGTYFADASVKISGNVNGGGTNPLPLTVIALGSIDVSGNVRVTPHHPLALQFVTNGDLKLAGNLNAEDPEIEGQSLVREQLSISGNPRLAGQIIVQDFRDCGQSCHSLLTENSVSGNVRLAYEGNHAADDTAGAGTPGTVEFTNNVTGWLEGL
jgi:cytoskeletal protein CcmA (bactofilin family)